MCQEKHFLQSFVIYIFDLGHIWVCAIIDACKKILNYLKISFWFNILCVCFQKPCLVANEVSFSLYIFC